MRNAFADEVRAAAAADPRVVLLSGDIGNRLFDPFKKDHPDRFVNCGVAEANMMSMAAGMAMAGLRPVVYTIVPFVTTRCLEQIRVDVCYQNQPVVIVGVGGGLSYASLGGTHHSLEDIGMLRILPGMSVLCPGDAYEVRGSLDAAFQANGPVYLRLGKKNEPLVHEQVPDVRVGRSLNMRGGSDVALLSVGNMLPIVMEAADLLAGHGIEARVESFLSVKPLDVECLSEVFANCRMVVTVEEHSVIGGAGSAVAEWLVGNALGDTPLLNIGTEDRFFHAAGSQDYARQCLGLTAESIVERVRAKLP